jgi:GT2 family glycosyltransferase
MIDLSIIIVNYNTRDFLIRNINSLIGNISDKISYEIIVVDNASADGSPSAISNFHPPAGGPISNIKKILNNKNVGFSRANNQGIKIMQKNKYVLFLNPDTIMQKSTIEKMIEFVDTHKDAGAATCKLIMLNGEIDDASHRGFPTPWNAFCHFSGLEKLFPKSKIFAGYSMGWEDLEREHVIDALAGAFMMVRREAGEDANWWDEDYFFYGEDIDFCYILKKKGWKVYYVPYVSVKHYKGVSGGIKKVSKNITTASADTKKLATHWRFKAMKIFYDKHYKQKYPWIFTQLIYLAISFKQKLS